MSRSYRTLSKNRKGIFSIMFVDERISSIKVHQLQEEITSPLFICPDETNLRLHCNSSPPSFFIILRICLSVTSFPLRYNTEIICISLMMWLNVKVYVSLYAQLHESAESIIRVSSPLRCKILEICIIASSIWAFTRYCVNTRPVNFYLTGKSSCHAMIGYNQ